MLKSVQNQNKRFSGCVGSFKGFENFLLLHIKMMVDHANRKAENLQTAVNRLDRLDQLDSLRYRK